jgi:hypothetical protein
MADGRREALLVAIRLSQLAESPIGAALTSPTCKQSTVTFPRMPQHRPGELRSDTSGWSKFRAIEGQVSV